MIDGRMRVVWCSLIALALTLGLTFCLNCQGPNPPPGKPSVPDGPSAGVNDSLYAFTSVAVDSCGDMICYRFDWGDGDTSAWTGWDHSGHRGGASHSWQAGGAFTVRAQAKDAAGAVSDWSEGHRVNILTLRWVRIFGWKNDDYGRSVQQTSDGGYIVAGSIGMAYPAGNADAWLIKADASGNKTWDENFGGTGYDCGYSVQQTSDGGYIFTGYTDFSSHGVGYSDVWLVKTDASGNKTWDKVFGGPGGDYGRSVQQTSDGGYVLTGDTRSGGGGYCDVWLIKTDASGNKAWDRTFGGADDDHGHSVQQTSDGGYIVAGSTMSYGAGADDVWLIKTDASGNKTWDKTFGGTDYDCGYSAQQTSDGGYVVAGDANMLYPEGNADAWLIKTDASGNKTWDNTFGGTHVGRGKSVQQTSDGGYVLTGETRSTGAGDANVWLAKTDASGNKTWDIAFGGSYHDLGYAVQQTSDWGYIITGTTSSYGTGGTDVWLMKVGASRE